MAGLPKPAKCGCGSTDLQRFFKPERWVCNGCNAIVCHRPQRNDPNKCRVCGAKRGDVPFPQHGNICKGCKRDYNHDYNVANKDKILAQHRDSYQRDKKKRQAAVRAAVQRSPEGFIRYLSHRLTKQSNYDLVHKGKLSPKCLDIQIDYDFLWALWESQKGICAIMGIPMVHKLNCLDSISIDRIDSSKGYVPGNVHLVCHGINCFKKHFPLSEVKRLLDAYYQARRLQEPSDDIPESF